MQERAHVRREALHLKRRDGSVAGAWSPGPLLAPLSELCALIHKALSNTRTWVHYEDGSASAKHPAQASHGKAWQAASPASVLHIFLPWLLLKANRGVCVSS